MFQTTLKLMIRRVFFAIQLPTVSQTLASLLHHWIRLVPIGISLSFLFTFGSINFIANFLIHRYVSTRTVAVSFTQKFYDNRAVVLPSFFFCDGNCVFLFFGCIQFNSPFSTMLALFYYYQMSLAGNGKIEATCVISS